MGVHEEVPKLKPTRSEGGESLTEEQRQKYAEQVQQFVKSTTPSRPLKPARSDNLDDGSLEGLVPTDSGKFELERFKELQAKGELLQTEGGVVNDDSHLETTYYDGLNSVDKSMHHETGSGFIARGEGGVAFTIGTDPASVFKSIHRTNPATNEWEPAPPENLPIEAKVHRSESRSEP